MPRFRAPAATGLALTLLLALAACAAPGPAPASSASTAAAADVCALVPSAPLRAVLGAEPGRGAASKGGLDGGRCTWTVSDAHTATARVTRQPDADLPASAYPQPKSGAAIEGVDRGWASAATHTILVVQDGRGLLFRDVGLRRARQADYDALAAAIVARLRLTP